MSRHCLSYTSTSQGHHLEVYPMHNGGTFQSARPVSSAGLLKFSICTNDSVNAGCQAHTWRCKEWQTSMLAFDVTTTALRSLHENRLEETCKLNFRAFNPSQ